MSESNVAKSGMMSSWAEDDGSSDEENDRRNRPEAVHDAKFVTPVAQQPDNTEVIQSSPANVPTDVPSSDLKPEPRSHGPSRREQRPPREPKPPLPVPDAPPFVAFVGNIPYSTVENDLAEFFRGLSITVITIPMGEGKPRGNAYVEFRERRHLEQALTFTGQEMQGRQIRVSVAPPKRLDQKRQNRHSSHSGPGRSREPPQNDSKEDSSPKVRPKLTLAPRTIRPESDGSSARNTGIFGTGKPREERPEELEKGLPPPADADAAPALSKQAPVVTSSVQAAEAGGEAPAASKSPESKEATHHPKHRSNTRKHGRDEERGDKPRRGGRSGRGDQRDADRKKPSSNMAGGAASDKKRERKDRRKDVVEEDEAAAAEKFKRQVEAKNRQETEQRAQESKQHSAQNANPYAGLVEDEEEDET